MVISKRRWLATRVDSEKAFRQLMREGVLATMRNYPYRVGSVVKVYHRGRYVGKAVVEDVVPVTEPNLRYLVGASGFDTIEEWVEEAKRLNKGRLPKYIVYIILIPEEGGLP